jgi:TonB family protein
MIRALTGAALLTLAWPQIASAQQEQRGEISTGQLTRPPVLLQSVPPEFPAEARALGLGGDVGLEVTLGTDGTVSDVKVVRSAGHGFDEAAVAAVKQFRFSPAEIDGQPAAVTIGYTEHFVSPSVRPVSDGGTGARAGLPTALKGTVRARGTRTPLPGAIVTADGPGVDPESGQVQSDADGHFEIRANPGPIALTIFDTSYELFTTSETVRGGELLEVSYYLRPRSFGLFETVVRAPQEKKEVNRYTVTRQEIESSPGAFSDPIRVLQDFPGVARPPFLLGSLLVRGSGPNDTGAYVDGIELPLLFHFVGGPSVINSEIVDNLDFYPGGFGGEYGRAIGGLVDVETRKTSVQGFHGAVSINLLDSSVYLTAPITKDLAVSAAGRRSYYDLFLPAIYRGTNVTTSILPRYDDYQLRIDYRVPDTRQRLQLSFYGSDDFLDVVQSPTSTAAAYNVTSQTSFWRLAARWIYDGPQLRASSQIWIGTNGNGQSGAGAAVNEHDQVVGARATIETDLLPSLGLRTGIDLLWTGVSLTQSGPPPEGSYRPPPGQSVLASPGEVTNSYAQSDSAAFGELNWRLPSQIRVVPSLRVDAYRIYDHWLGAVDPRLTVIKGFGALFVLPGPTELKGAIGLYHEAAYPNELSPVLGNPNLPLQQALQTSLGIDHAFTEAIHASLTGFFSYETHLAEATTAVTVAPDGSVQPDNFLPTGVIRAYGVEVFVRHELSRRLFAWLAYTLSFSELLDPELPGANAAGFHTSPFDETNLLTVIGQYRFDGGWQLGARFRLTSGLPTTPYVGATFQPDQQSYAPIYGVYNSARLPPFHQLDIRVDKEWLFSQWSLDVYLDIQNVYNAANVEFQFPDYRYRTYQTIQGIPILPTFGVRARF